MSLPPWTDQLFAAIDRRDADAFARHLAADVVFQFGNAAPVQGRAAVREAVAGFFSSIAGLAHTVERGWDTGDAVIVRGQVTYTRHDGRTLTVPFANLLELADDRIARYGIFIDISSLAG